MCLHQDVIADRIKTVLDKLINTDRLLKEDIRLIYDFMQYTENQQIPGLLVLILTLKKLLIQFHGISYITL